MAMFGPGWAEEGYITEFSRLSHFAWFGFAYHQGVRQGVTDMICFDRLMQTSVATNIRIIRIFE